MVYMAADHAGFELKQNLVQSLSFEIKDLGTSSPASVDYPDYADRMAKAIKSDLESKGVLICGSGQGMAIRANRFPFIRAALCFDEQQASLSREHNDANVLCLAARLITFEQAKKIIDAFLNTEFAHGRHEARVNKLNFPIKGES